MGGKSSPSNNQMVQFEMQQAADARAKEELRQNRLNAGKAAVDQLFGPTNFGEPFYGKYQKASLDYNLPQLTTQYDKAKRDMTFDLTGAAASRAATHDAPGAIIAPLVILAFVLISWRFRLPD